MASKRALKRKQCQGKKKYEKTEAIRTATVMRHKYPGQSFDGYPCPNCGSWHVGHRTWKNQQRITARRKSA